MGVNFCPGCFEKQRRIDQLQEEVRSLKQKLRYRQRQAQEGAFGSSTPSARRPFVQGCAPPVVGRIPSGSGAPRR